MDAKKILVLGFLTSVALMLAFADRHMYVYRSDRGFNALKYEELSTVSHSFDSLEGEVSSFDSVFFELADSTGIRVAAHTIDSVVIRSAAIPDLYVELLDYPELEDLLKDATHNKKTIYRASLKLEGNGTHPDFKAPEVEFRGRGNTTWGYPKTPYRFKLPKKASICGFEKAKSYALIANYIDPTSLRNDISLWLARRLRLPFSNHSVPVNVHFNGKPRGLYMLTEKIGINSGSVDIDENNGILFELDSNYDEDYKFKYAFPDTTGRMLPVNVKDPDLAEVAPDSLGAAGYFEKWKEDFTAMADSVVTGAPIDSLIDLDTAVGFLLVNNLAANFELRHPKSFYIHKRSFEPGVKYKFGPVWDFDWAYEWHGMLLTGEELLNRDYSYAGASFLTAIARDKEFQTLYAKYWQAFKEEIFGELLAHFDLLAAELEPSAKLNGLIWKETTLSGGRKVECSFDYKDRVAYLRDWLVKRVEYLDSHPTFGLYPPTEGECWNPASK